MAYSSVDIQSQHATSKYYILYLFLMWLQLQEVTLCLRILNKRSDRVKCLTFSLVGFRLKHKQAINSGTKPLHVQVCLLGSQLLILSLEVELFFSRKRKTTTSSTIFSLKFVVGYTKSVTNHPIGCALHQGQVCVIRKGRKNLQNLSA